MGFFATIGRGWEMSKLSMSVVKKDPELMVYMIFAGVMSLACLVGMSIPQLFEMEWAVNADSSFTGAYLGFTFIAYMVLSIIVVFWNCAIVANANIRLTGGDPTFADGVNAAFKRLPIIIVWGIIAGTVGLILKFLEGAARSSDHPGMKVVASIIAFFLAASASARAHALPRRGRVRASWLRRVHAPPAAGRCPTRRFPPAPPWH